MRVGELSRDIELEVIVVWNNQVSQLDDGAASLLECLLEQDGLQCRI